MSKLPANIQSQIDHITTLYKEKKITQEQAKQDLFQIFFKYDLDLVNFADEINIKKEKYEKTQPFTLLVLNLKYDTFKGKMAVGKINSGSIKKNQDIVAVQKFGTIKGRVADLMIFDGLGVKEVETAEAGEIVMIAGLSTVEIGDTITTEDYKEPVSRIKIDEPTIQMTFGVNTSPFSGKEGKLGTSRQILERLNKELETNVALRVEVDPTSTDKFIVSGRGELHLSVLIEAMRREGFELEISQPEVIFKEEDNQIFEPFEIVEIDVAQEYQGVVMQELGKRSADIKQISPNEVGTEYHFEALMPTRTIIGLKSLLITETKGTVIMNTIFYDFLPKMDIEIKNEHGSLISTHTGKATGYALDNAQQRGTLFIKPGDEVYTGMVLGQSSKDQDLELNPTKEKKLSNVRSKSSDDAITLSPPREMTLENCMEYIGPDELLEVTPLSLRIRKRYLDPNERKRNS
jgi:GTP-binding protein